MFPEQIGVGLSVLPSVGFGFTITETSCVFKLTQPLYNREKRYFTKIGSPIVSMSVSLISEYPALD